MLGPASDLVFLKSGVDYFGERLIFSIHCIKTNECDVLVKTINSEVVFPPGSFVRGAVYHIFIKEMVFDENKAGFIGYKKINKS